MVTDFVDSGIKLFSLWEDCEVRKTEKPLLYNVDPYHICRTYNLIFFNKTK